jgi:hypothetical protein
MVLTVLTAAAVARHFAPGWWLIIAVSVAGSLHSYFESPLQIAECSPNFVILFKKLLPRQLDPEQSTALRLLAWGRNRYSRD